MKMGIAFKEAVVELVQDGLCQLCVLSGSAHIVFVSHLENHLIKRFFLISVTDFFVVVFDAAVFAFLLGIVLRLCCIKQLVVRFLDGCVAVFNVQMGAGRVNIFCDIGTAIVGNDAVTGHCADGSFHCVTSDFSVV